jgi:hypothetical protein
MEFHSRKACIEYYNAQYPHLPRYMIELAFDLDQEQSNKKMTGAERRALKREVLPKRESHVIDVIPGVAYGSATVVPFEDYQMPPMVKGAIEVNGAEVKELISESLETAECESNELSQK